MTGARRPRSAALLVGSTSGTSANVQSAGQSLSRFFASACTCRCRFPISVDDWGAQAALGSVVGRLDVGNLGERPERGPEFEQVLRERMHVPLPLPDIGR